MNFAESAAGVPIIRSRPVLNFWLKFFIRSAGPEKVVNLRCLTFLFVYLLRFCQIHATKDEFFLTI
jgi:hypothetical protein